jgi:hypothetical protein
MDDGLKQMGLQADRADIPARLAGVKAGVVRLGHNGFGYSKEHGSWVNIVSWFIDAELPADEPTTECPCPPECGNCLKTCPIDAITHPFVMLADLEPHLSLEALSQMDEKTYREMVQPNFWYIPPENIGRWHRNARRAMGSSVAGNRLIRRGFG